MDQYSVGLVLYGGFVGQHNKKERKLTPILFTHHLQHAGDAFPRRLFDVVTAVDHPLVPLRGETHVERVQ